jgi:hypothetical protein
VRFVLAMLIATAAGCLDGQPSPPPPVPAADPSPQPPAGKSDQIGTATATIPEPAEVSSPTDLGAPPDLTGITDCFGVAQCDQASMLCIKYLLGTPGNPGAVRTAPACFTPVDACPNGVFDCTCIQQDPSLGMSCGRCFDNGDHTFTCYAM